MSDDVTQRSENGDDSVGGLKINWVKIGAYALVAILGYKLLTNIFTSGFSHVEDATLSRYDEDTLASVLNGEMSEGYLLPEDTTPAVIVLDQTGYTDQEILDITAGLYDRYSVIGESIAASLETDVQSVFDLTVIVAAQAQGTMTEAGLDLYFQAMDLWAPRFDSALKSTADAVATIAAAQVAGINNSTECTETILVKDIVEESEVTDTSSYVVELKNNSDGGFLGMNKSKSSKETRTTIMNYTRNDVRHISYVPVCIGWQLDPTQLGAIMAVGSLAVQMQYSLLSAVLAMAPKAANFVKPVTPVTP